MAEHIAFIGGGNMASAIISGLLRGGTPRELVHVVEPFADTRARLLADFGIAAQPQASDDLAHASVLIWAVKPQTFKEAANQVRGMAAQSLHLSVAAGIPSQSIAAWLGNERVIRTMPNTPALIGKGITALFARDAASAADRALAERIMRTTGDILWVDHEAQLNAVTALSGSGPAYMFYFMEAMTTAGTEMGLSAAQAYQLAVATFIGAGDLARNSNDPPQLLRERVTSKGGTTYAAITSMDASHVKAHFIEAMHAAGRRAQELGEEFGK